jgi:hypothetical protein
MQHLSRSSVHIDPDDSPTGAAAAAWRPAGELAGHQADVSQFCRLSQMAPGPVLKLTPSPATLMLLPRFVMAMPS